MTVSNFSIWTKRNNYEVDRVSNAFNYTTLSGDLNSTLTVQNSEAGVQTKYSFSIDTQHTLESSNKI